MKKILITGADGFIAKNLKFKLKELGMDFCEFKKGDKLENFLTDFKNIYFIFHLAGVNRPKDKKEFYEVNSDLTKNLINFLEKNNLNIPIVFTSSIQAEKENDYGKSKLLAEKKLIDYSEKNKVPVFVYRLPNIFGKWSKPNYNSFIATFCYNISRDLPIEINDKNALINLSYIDDLINEFINLLKLKSFDLKKFYYNLEKIYQVSVGEVAEKLYFYKNSRNTIYVNEVGTDFERALYATYLSFLEKNNFSYPLTKHEDERGIFTEIVKTKNSGQFSVFTSKKGVTRGEHYHHTKTEKFLVVKGEALFKFKNILNGDCAEYKISDKDFKVVETPPGWSHSIENISEEEIVVLIWTNEIFDKNNPDTIKYNIN